MDIDSVAVNHVTNVASKLLSVARWGLAMFVGLLMFSIASAFGLGQWFARFDGRMERIEMNVAALAEGVVASNAQRSLHNDNRLDALERWSERLAAEMKASPPTHPKESR